MLSFDKRLTGVKLSEFREIIRKVSPKWAEIRKKKKIAGRTSKLKTLEDEVLLVLIYYRFYVSFQFVEMLFDLDESNICRHIQKIEPILVSAIKINKNRKLTQSDLETILIDATEIPIQRPSKNQRKYYSGKKKRHTMKFEIQTDIKGKIIGISKSYNGKPHDFKIRKISDHVPRNALVLADSGYQGLQKLHPKTILPHDSEKFISPMSKKPIIHSLLQNEFSSSSFLLSSKISNCWALLTETSEKNSISVSISSPESIICASLNFFSSCTLFFHLIPSYSRKRSKEVAMIKKLVSVVSLCFFYLFTCPQPIFRGRK